MRQALTIVYSTSQSIFLVVLVALVVAGCGLGMDTQGRLDRGQKALAAGEYRAAVIDAKNILLEEPNNAAARLLLGRASVEIGDGISAEKELRKAAELGSESSAVLVDLGRALLLQSKFNQIMEDINPKLAATGADRLAAMRTRGEALIGLRQPVAAREIFAEVLASDADDILAQLGVVKSYIAERNHLQARETLNHVLAVDEEFVPTLQLSGTLNLKMRNLTRAAIDFERAANLAKANADARSEFQALYGLADSIFLQEKPDEVRVVLQRMTEVGPEDLRTMLVTARLAAADKDWTSAQENLQEILRRAPKFQQARLLLGVVHKESGNLNQAEMYLSAVVAASPDNSRARRLLAETRFELNKVEAARRTLEPLISGTDSDIVSLSMAAEASLSLGDVDEAVELLERGIATDPGNADLKVQLAIAYLRGGQLDKAQQTLESLPDMSGQRSEFRSNVLGILTQMAQGNQIEALENARSLREEWRARAEAHSLVGSIEMATGKLEAARSSFNEGLKTAPDDIRIIRYLAQLDIAEDNPQAAQDRYHIILELEPGDASSMVSLARLAARSENHDNARLWLERARAADPSSVSARSLLAAWNLAYREYAMAEEVAKEAVDLSPDSAKLQNYLGLAQYYGKNYRGAIFSLGKAAELAPNEPSYRFNLARAQAAQGNNSSALVSLRDSMDQSLQHVPSGVLLASIKAKSGDLDGAQDIARRLRELHPDEAAPYVLEAELLAQRGDLPGAANAYDKALDIEMTRRYAIRAYQVRNQLGTADQVEPLNRFLEVRPLDTDMRNYLAHAYKNTGETGNANAQYERVLAQEPENFIAANNLAWNYFESGDSRAEEMARRAYVVRPDIGSIVDTLGWILVKKGSLEEGIAMLRNASELGSGQPDIRFHLAAGLVAAGQTTEAKTILQEILAIEDEFSSRDEAESLVKSL